MMDLLLLEMVHYRSPYRSPSSKATAAALNTSGRKKEFRQANASFARNVWLHHLRLGTRGDWLAQVQRFDTRFDLHCDNEIR